MTILSTENMFDGLLRMYKNIMQYEDPRSKNYFLMGSPLWIIIILTFYIRFVLKSGPVFMKSRPPMKLDRIIFIYNWVQIIANATLLLVVLKRWSHYSYCCSPIDKSDTPLAVFEFKLQYCYFLLKILDLLDTVFFVLRKKQNQITFLHLYHHVMMSSGGWILTKFFVGGQLYFMGIANLFVHTVMYFYYFLAAYGDNIWWKKYITQMQIAQHCFVFISFAIAFFNPHCDYPKILLGVYLIQAVVIITLFVKFYIKTYITGKQNVQ